MSKPRKVVQSLGYFGEFYEDEIQAILQKGASRNSVKFVFETFFLLSGSAFADYAGATAADLEKVGGKLLQLELKDRAFYSELKAAIEKIRSRPSNRKRTVPELAVELNGLISGSWHEWLRSIDKSVPDGLLSPKSLAHVIRWKLGKPIDETRWQQAPEVTPGSVKVALSRERRRRESIDKVWEKLCAASERRPPMGNKKPRKV